MITIHKKDGLQTDENYLNYITDFVKFAAAILNMKDDFNLFLLGKGQDGESTTGGYSPSENTIRVLYQDRALVDILRSIAHEMEHQRQNNHELIQGKPQNIGGFLENDANIIAGILIKLYVKATNNHNLYWM